MITISPEIFQEVLSAYDWGEEMCIRDSNCLVHTDNNFCNTLYFSVSSITSSSPTLMVPPCNTFANTPSRGMMQSPTTL